MDFWGVEVKSGEPCLVEPGENRFLHLSQACLGEVKKDKGNEYVHLYATVDGKKLVLGTLSSEKFPQLQFDLAFNKKFELSHNWKKGSVYFCGYRCDNQSDEFIITIEDESESESDEDLPVPGAVAEDGKSKPQAMPGKPPAAEHANTAKPDSAAAKQKVKIVEPKKDVKTIEEDGSSEDDLDTDSSEFESGSDEDEGSDSEIGDDEDKETPKKVELSKKRPAESAPKTPGPDKKAKLVTPQKTDTKKGGGHVATPHPSKQAGKTPANQSKQQTPKPAGSHPCKSCNRSFNSENALESHTKAKHTGGK